MAGETILVVEDNPMNMELVADILENHGYTVVKVTTGADAIPQVREILPDLVLMDIQLPGLDGLTVTSILKDSPDTREIPVIALTAHAMRGDEEKARQAGCDGYVSKPINTRELPITISNFLAQRNQDTNPNES